MLVKLRRDFSVDGYFFKARSYGVEIPAEINGKSVVLPKDAEVLGGPAKEKPVKKETSKALSELGVSKPVGFADAMKPVDDED